MIYLEHLLEATGGSLRYPGKQTRFAAFSHDSRQLIPGELFVAVRGERSDGHNYILDATRRGAAGLLIEAAAFNALSSEVQSELEQASLATILVADTRLALQDYARAILQRWHPTVIAVTGSVGKTSTKEAIATVLASNFATFRSWQNYNDLLGLPLSLGKLEERHEYAVLELGCDHPGEIAALCRLVQPHIGVLTNVSPTLLQYFGSLENFAAELGTLFTSLADGSYAVFNQYDDLTRPLIDSTRRITFLPFAPSQAYNVKVSWEGVSCEIPPEAAGASKPLTLNSRLLGAHHVSTMLAAYTVARRCGLQPEEIQAALTQVTPLPGRLNPLPGVYGSQILDDTHNAQPASALAGLSALKALPAGLRIAILGDMHGLGSYEENAHRQLGQAAVRYVDYLITRGERAAISAEAARQAGLAPRHVIVTSSHEDAARAARSILETHQASANVSNVVWLKGSEEMRMERVAELLLAQPADAPEQLVRQTPGWKQIVVTRPERPTWLEIDLSAIASNTRKVKDVVGPKVRVLASLKADAYGHGALKVARTVLQNGASMLGVATVSEASPLREAGISAPILVFGYVPSWQMREALRLDLAVTLYASSSAQALSRAALALHKTARVHVKVDSGMGRLGIRSEQLDEIVGFVREIKELPGLELEGLYTHFAVADMLDLTLTRRQLSRFQQVLSALEEQGLRPPIVHACNSAATLSLPEAHFDMVRPGIAIYGLDPSPEVRLPEGFRAALSFKTQVSQVKWVPAGEGISYGYTYITERPTLVAILPVGYADGFRRAPTNWGSVLIHGQEAPILGRVCMDQCIVDVTHIPQTRMGDEVVLIGRQGEARLSAEQVAERLGTSNCEVVAEILARVPRVD
ncbi:alanine racemase [Ktedonosporobacter rubrisoli]|uniref:Multifunctional fusion protein n=1 Tax=Ktedonosporobacter rubrisoli TaxID=2509675 RepID=A0A4P6JVF0_KTERU|nr:alanine racemase [Ktedonosporobacter rubrisoli]QBD79322.1 alanine racemase [Ktedonosporobacter rubrisoli]